jgi:hypothetical protein
MLELDDATRMFICLFMLIILAGCVDIQAVDNFAATAPDADITRSADDIGAVYKILKNDRLSSPKGPD